MKVLFETNKNNWISRTILRFTKQSDITGKPVSHAAPIYGYAFGCEWALSADEILVNVVDINRYRTPGHILRIYEIPDRIPTSEWVPKLTKQCNQKIYPHLELIWFMYRWIRRKLNPKWNGRNWLNYSIFCSELTVIALRMAGFEEELKKIDENTTDPIELENIVRNIEGSRLIEYLDI